jgi:hypothetical protein
MKSFGQNVNLNHVTGQDTNSLQETKRKNVTKLQSCAPLIFGRHLGSDKNVSSMKYVRPKYKPIYKN